MTTTLVVGVLFKATVEGPVVTAINVAATFAIDVAIDVAIYVATTFVIDVATFLRYVSNVVPNLVSFNYFNIYYF